MKFSLPVTIAVLALLVNGDVTAQVSSTPPCRARTLDLRAASGMGTATSQPIIAADGIIDLLNVDNNYWGTISGNLVDPNNDVSGCTNCKWTITLTSIINAQATSGNTLAYVASSGGRRTSASTLPDVSCGTGWGGGDIAKKGSKPQSNSNVTIDSTQECTNLYISGYEASTNRQWQVAFDSLKKFIETCPYNPQSPHAFSQISTAVNGLYGSNGGTYRDIYLNWLESVLYLNTKNPEYFCADVEAMSGSLPLKHDTAPGYASRWTNVALALDAWLIHNTTCDTPILAQEYDQARQTQGEQWQNNPTVYKLDTTLPPLDSIQPGLKELLEKHLLFASVGDKPVPIIVTNATANPNPTGGGTVITFSMTKEAYVKINLFNVLGEAVTSPGYEGLFPPGNHAVPLSLQGLPSGTYYARILTAYGSVATVKLVKE